MTLWTNNTQVIAREGMVAEEPNPSDVHSFYSQGQIRVGLLVELGSDEDEDETVRAVQALPVADPNGIVATALASAATATLYDESNFDGVNTTERIHPPQRLSITLNASADWPDAAMSVRYENPAGYELVEDLLIPAGGNVVLYTHGICSVPKSVWFPICGGVGGEALVGWEPTVYGVDRRGFPGIAIYDRMREPSATTTVTVDDEETISVLKRGKIWVTVEADVKRGFPVYVRMVEVATDLRGQFRGSPATNFCRLPNAYFITGADADGLAIVELGG